MQPSNTRSIVLHIGICKVTQSLPSLQKVGNSEQTLSQTCNNSSREVDVDDAGGEGGQDHSQRGKEAAYHHHWTTSEAVNQHTAQRTWRISDALSQAVCLSGLEHVHKTALEILEAGTMKLISFHLACGQVANKHHCCFFNHVQMSLRELEWPSVESIPPPRPNSLVSSSSLSSLKLVK